MENFKKCKNLIICLLNPMIVIHQIMIIKYYVQYQRMKNGFGDRFREERNTKRSIIRYWLIF